MFSSKHEINNLKTKKARRQKYIKLRVTVQRVRIPKNPDKQALHTMAALVKFTS